MQLARHFGQDFEEEFVTILEKGPSNLPQYKTARGVWEQMVRPARIELDRVLAHYAMSLIYRERETHSRVYCYDLESLDHEVQSRGSNHLAVGRLRVRSELTRNEAATSFVVIHYGGLDFYTALRKSRSAEEYEAFKRLLFDSYAAGSLADVTALVARDFGGEVYRLDDLFLEEQRRVIGIVLQDRFEDYQRAFERLADQDADVMNILGRLHYPIPGPLRAAASVCLDNRIRRDLVHLGENGNTLPRVRQLFERGHAWGYRIIPEAVSKTLADELRAVLSEINAVSDLPALAAHAARLLDAAFLLGISLDLWQEQNQLLDRYAELAAAGSLDEPLRRAFAHLAERLNISPDLLGWQP
jgi:hypothetical protein